MTSDAPVMRVVEERHGTVLVLTLDQPARRNALSMPLRTALTAALERAQSDKGTRAVVITGAGDHFCSGGDISGMDVKSPLEGRERMRLSHQLIRLMVMGGVPVVAAIEGFCVGAGLSLACACDTIVAADDARLGAGFGRIGLMADLGLPHTLPLRVGQGRARQILFYHEQMTASAAERIGLVDVVVPKGHALEQERHFQSTLFLTEDFAEGRAAFLGKRQPEFKGG